MRVRTEPALWAEDVGLGEDVRVLVHSVYVSDYERALWNEVALVLFVACDDAQEAYSSIHEGRSRSSFEEDAQTPDREVDERVLHPRHGLVPIRQTQDAADRHVAR